MKWSIDEKPVPMPEKQRKTSAYPWKQIELGGSFYIATDSTDHAKMSNTVMNAMRYQNKKGPEKFEMRVSEGVIRVWRVA